jgi:hypothetical protein
MKVALLKTLKNHPPSEKNRGCYKKIIEELLQEIKDIPKKEKFTITDMDKLMREMDHIKIQGGRKRKRSSKCKRSVSRKRTTNRKRSVNRKRTTNRKRSVNRKRTTKRKRRKPSSNRK